MSFGFLLTLSLFLDRAIAVAIGKTTRYSVAKNLASWLHGC